MGRHPLVSEFVKGTYLTCHVPCMALYVHQLFINTPWLLTPVLRQDHQMRREGHYTVRKLYEIIFCDEYCFFYATHSCRLQYLLTYPQSTA